ncbi:BnaC09g31100D [Brassica napus]|uniref:(rape) hypothetical protein n=1 Tax=Brassica napus TaxID=3708 RepID=A0A078IBB6_BRANA|nr:unnamed protein product [Brassica napus]CDY47447.1 BnaC09g31100D [Brassica napus]
MQFSIRLRSGPLPRFARAPICTRRVFDSYRLRTETWGLEVQFDRESSVCEDSFMQSGDIGRASSPSITLCDAYSAIGDSRNSSPSLFVRELVSSMAFLVAHAVMKHCLHSDCLCGVLSKSQGRTQNCIVKTLVDAFIVVARDLVGTRLEVIEMHVFGVQLVDTVLLLFHQNCVVLNKCKNIVEVVSMLVTILQYQAYL